MSSFHCWFIRALYRILGSISYILSSNSIEHLEGEGAGARFSSEVSHCFPPGLSAGFALKSVSLVTLFNGIKYGQLYQNYHLQIPSACNNVSPYH